MAQDPLGQRRHEPTIPLDLNDPPRFAQMVETVKDALVEEFTLFFNTQALTTERRQEAPTISKYAIGFGTNLDPYETFLKIVAEFPDVLERMSHVAVTTASGNNNRMSAGQPIIAHTQLPPRIVSANPGPYVLQSNLPQVSTAAIAALAPGTYTLTLNGVPFSFTALAGTTNETILAELRTLLLNVVGLAFSVTATQTLLTITGEAATPFTLTGTANLTIATTQTAGTVASPNKLVYRTTPDGRNAVQSEVLFSAKRLKTTEPIGAVPADAIARIFNEQAVYAEASTVPVGVGTGVRLQTGGPKGGKTPNEVEVLSGSTPSLVTALGLGNFGVAAGGDSITGQAPSFTLNIAAAPFTVVMASDGRYVTISGAPTLANNGRFPITSVPTTSQLVFTNPDGVAEALTAGTSAWFVGYRDDWKDPARPVMNRYHLSAKFTVNIDILAESPNERREVTDLVWSHLMFFLELKFFTLYGRGIFDEAYPDEMYQISVGQDVQNTGETDFPRPTDEKNRVHASRIVLPVTATYFIDRPVLVPYGPKAGQQWVVDPADVLQDDSLPRTN